MPVHEFQTAFNAGQLSEQMAARVDTQKYKLGAECLRNFFVLPRGGIARRAGSIFMGEAKYRDKLCVLARFEFSITQAYILEIGHLYMRFWADRGRVLDADDNIVEVETPYTEDDLRALRYEQSADVMWFAHRSHAPYKLERLSSTEFRFVAVRFLPPPTYEPKTAYAIELTLSALTGTAQTITASQNFFLTGDVGRTIRSNGGEALITAIASSPNATVTVDILVDFTETVLTDGTWTLDGSPQTSITIEFGSQGGVGARKLAKTYHHDAVTGNDTDTEDAFRSDDVGKFILVAGGVFKIIEFQDARNVFVTIQYPTDQVPTAFAGNWTLEVEAWTATLGYPGVVRLSEQRLWWFGSPEFPDTAWASVVGDYENMGRGPDADDALVEPIAASGVNLTRWAHGIPEGLALGTLANELTIEGESDKAISVDSIRIRARTDWGSDHDVDALKVDRVIMFVQRGGQKLRELSFDFASNTYQAQDMTALTDVTAPGVVQMAVARTPECAIFLVRSDGLLLSLTYERAQEVVGWAHHDTDGLYESVATIPNQCGTWDEIWTVVKRSAFSQGGFISTGYFAGGYFAEGFFSEGDVQSLGNYIADGYFAEGYFASGYFAGPSASIIRRYLEVFDGAMRLDAALTYSGVATDTFDGLDHLNGKLAKVIIDTGAVYDATVEDGSITLPVQTQSAEIGLLYTATGKTLRPEMATQFGSIQGRRMRWNTVSFRVYCTEGHIVLNEEELQFPENTRLPFTGDLRPQTAYGWNRHGQHEFHVLEPKKVTILGLAGSLQVDDAAR